MSVPSIEELQKVAVNIVVQARKNNNLSKLTPRAIREQIEEKFGLEKGVLDAKEYRRPIKEAMTAANTNSTSITRDLPTAKAPKYKSLEFVATSDMEQDEPDDRPSDDDAEAEKPPAKRQKDSEDEDTETEKPAPKKRKKSESEASPSSKRLSSPTALESDVDSDVVSGPPKLKKKAKATEKSKATGAKRATKKKTTEVLSKDEVTIKRLKGFVNACGVRKVWSKLFAGIEDNPSKQIKVLRDILADLGMSGRPSMEQAKAIKEKRDLASELEDVQKFEKAVLNQGSRRTKQATKEDKEDEQDEPSDEEDTRPAKRKSTARQSIMAFLGDQSDSD